MSTESPTFHQSLILVADDDQLNQKILNLNLIKLGYKADFVSTGREAVTASFARLYGLILMDYFMPEMDGLEAAMEIRATAGPNRETPIIMLTAQATEPNIVKWQEAGISDILEKPFKLEQFRRVIETWLNRPKD